MGWQDDPVVSQAPASAKPAWMSDPVVGGAKPSTSVAPESPSLLEHAFNVGYRGPAEAIANLVSGMFAKPVSDVAGMAAIPMHALGMDRDPERVRQQVASALTFQPKTAEGRAMAEYNPLALAAKLFGGAGDMAQNAVAPANTSGPARSVIGSGLGEVVRQLPALLAGPAAKLAAGPLATLAKSQARESMMSALKPRLGEFNTGDAGRAVDTMLNEGVNVTHGGSETLRGMIDAINQQIKDKIAGSTATVSKEAIAAPLTETLKRVTQQVNPNADIASVNAAKNEFMNHPALPKVTPAKTVESPILDEGGRPFTTEIPESGTEQIPVQTAQEIKQGTYRALGDKAYNGELKSADTMSQKDLARGAKEQVAEAVPEVGPLNAKESELINAVEMAERAVFNHTKTNPGSLGPLGGHLAGIAAFLAGRSPLSKSLIAHGLNATAEALPGAAEAAPIAAATTEAPRKIPKAPKLAKDRVEGVVYSTPKGNKEWSSDGWLTPEN